MNADDFRDLVRRMRAAQRRYFATRDRAVLAEAQRLEAEVDRALDQQTGGLFDGVPSKEPRS